MASSDFGTIVRRAHDTAIRMPHSRVPGLAVCHYSLRMGRIADDRAGLPDLDWNSRRGSKPTVLDRRTDHSFTRRGFRAPSHSSDAMMKKANGWSCETNPPDLLPGSHSSGSPSNDSAIWQVRCRSSFSIQSRPRAETGATKREHLDTPCGKFDLIQHQGLDDGRGFFWHTLE